jgi:serine protease
MKKLLYLFVTLIFTFLVSTPVSAQGLLKSKNSRERAAYSHGYSRDTIELKIADTSDVTASDGQISGNAAQVGQLKSKLRGVKKAQKLFRSTEKNQRSFKDRAARTTGKNIPNAHKYITVTVPETNDIGSVAKELEALDFVESATPKMLPAPAPSADYSGLQTYLTASKGINSVFANNFAGGKGENVTIVDLEYSWNVDHEDLSTLDNTDKKFVGTYADPFADTNHGTAVASILVADHNGSGVNGIAPKADLKLVNTYSATYQWDIANSIYSSLAFMQPGDIMLIEQQAFGRSSDPYGYVPVEIMPSVYDAIVTATSMGITVIEPAGNGNQNLSNTALYGTSFPDGKPNSGAIIVGSSNSCSETQPNARHYSSSYGSRVNTYADGDCVTAAGYGTIQGGANSEYTSYFNGTSSASAIAAGAAALVSSTAQAAGKTLTPLQLRTALTTTGLAQDTIPENAYIGRKPQIRQAIFANVNVGLTSCYASDQWFALNISRNYFKNPTVEDAQKFAVNLVANAYKDNAGTQPVNFSTNGPWCRTTMYNSSEIAQLEKLANYLELDYQTTQSYSGALLGILLVYFGIVK